MSTPEPFTHTNVITATMDVLNAYPEDSYAKQAKHALGYLRTCIGYAAPENIDNKFWYSSLNHEGYYDICRAFHEPGSRSVAIMALYSAVQAKYKSDGFDTFSHKSER